jgi:hypothetical protein
VILIILTAYWLVVGLFDWFLVHKVLKRPIMTWITLPLWIVLFGTLTYVIAAPGRPTSGRDGNATITNVLTIYDVDDETGTKRTSMWQGWYSQDDRFISNDTFSHPDIPGSERDKSAYLSWHGLPGSGLGGMAPNTVSPPVWQVGSEQLAYSKIERVPIQTRSTKSFFGQSNNFLRAYNYRIHAQLSDREGVPVGTLEVPDDFSFRLTNAILVYGRWALELGDIQPGQMIELTRTTPRIENRLLLIPPELRGDANLRGLATYNPQSTDLEYIVRVMSLHRHLGGFESTGLHHAYKPTLDMSNLLTADRVLLIGTIDEHVDEHNRTGIFRQSFPITLTDQSTRLRIERHEWVPDDLEERVQPGFIDRGAGGR